MCAGQELTEDVKETCPPLWLSVVGIHGVRDRGHLEELTWVMVFPTLSSSLTAP